VAEFVSVLADIWHSGNDRDDLQHGPSGCSDVSCGWS